MQKNTEEQDISIFSFTSYKEYLRKALPTSGPGRGIRARLAKALNCQAAFISQVLQGNGHFSMEHAYAVSKFLELQADETQFLLLLVQKEKAATQELQRYFRKQIESTLKSRQKIKDRLKIKNEDSPSMQAIYYSSWLYSAVHVMTSIPAFQSPRAISEHLKLPLATIKDCLDTLCQFGLVAEKEGIFKITAMRIHIGQSSPLVSIHHSNWRLRAIQSLQIADPNDIHYSSVITLSEGDALKIREILLDALEQQEKILAPSKEEAVFSLSLDFFRL